MATKKAERAITFESNEAGTVLTFRSANGDSFALALDRLSDGARAAAVAFGVARKVTNAAALDAGASVEEKWTAVKEVAQRLASGGDWNAASRVAGGGSGASGLVVLALARVYGTDLAAAEATIARTMEKKGIDRKAALVLWAGTDKVAAAMAAIRAERAAAKASKAGVDSDSLLGELED